MKKYIPFLILFFSLSASFCQDPPPAIADPEIPVNLYVSFDRPWFPQWTEGVEVSNKNFGYRMAGFPVNMTISGYNLDPGEEIEVENRDTLGRTVSRETFKVDFRGWAYLRIETELPDEFLTGRFYYIWLTRESGAAVNSGCFYVGEPPPEGYYYSTWGNLTYGFSCDAAGKPYLLSWISNRDGPNILDNYNLERGREFQGDLFDGYPDHGDNFRWDSVDPTQGGGDYGRILPTVEGSQVEPRYIWAKFKALDYPPNDPKWTGPYRQKVIKGRWPELGWMLETEYKLGGNDVLMYNRFWHTDNFYHRVHQIRTAQVFLNPVFFQNPPLNEKKRVDTSYLLATIDDERVEAYSHALGLKITFRAEVDKYESYYFQRQWNYRDYYGLADPGEVQVWECLNVAEINKLVAPGEVLSGWGRLTISEAYLLGLGFDMEKFRAYMLMITEQYRHNWEE